MAARCPHCTNTSSQVVDEAQQAKEVANTLPQHAPADDTQVPVKPADSVEVFKPAAVLARLTRVERDKTGNAHSNVLTQTLLSMRYTGPYRRLAMVTPAKLKRIAALRTQFPNLQELLDKVCTYLRLALVGRPPVIHLPPICLVGSAGIGKTIIIERLAGILEVSSRFVACPELTAGFVLSGTSSQWGNSSHGTVAKVLLESEEANPLVVLDELDKIPRDNRWPADGPLYRLLERATAKTFRDEFLDIELDVSRFLWIATANTLDAIPAPLLSRLDVVRGADPTREQMAAIADSVNVELRKDHPSIRQAFPALLPKEVKDVLGTRAPRELKQTLLSAYGRAIERGRTGRRFTLQAQDIPEETVKSGRPIGFAP